MVFRCNLSLLVRPFVLSLSYTFCSRSTAFPGNEHMWRSIRWFPRRFLPFKRLKKDEAAWSELPPSPSIDTPVIRSQQGQASLFQQRSPFQVMHTDILSLIFVLSLPFLNEAANIHPPSLALAPLNVLHVCCSWREVVMTTPQMLMKIYFAAVFMKKGY